MGTSDCTVLNFGGGVFEVISTNGDSHLGGDDFDQVIIDYLAEDFKKENNIDLKKDSMALQRLKEAAEKAKIELSSSTETEINLPYITVVDGAPKHLVKTINRAKFESLSQELISRLHILCQNALQKSKLAKSDIDEVILVGGSTRIPAVANVAAEEFGKEPSKGINPDEAVATGAAIQGAVLNQESGVGDIVLLDVTPLSLGIETMGGVMTKLIEANTTIPCKKSQVFSTAEDNQSSVQINVLQGERPMAADNKSVGMFMLDGILPARRGVPQIEVTFDIDANGVINVTAKDKATNKEQSIRINNGSGLSKEEIDKIKADAEAHKAEDEKREADIKKLNQAESYVYSLEDTLNKTDKISEDDKKKVSESLSKLKEVIKNKEADKVDEAMKAVQDVFNPIAEAMYKATQNTSSSNTNTNNNTANDTTSEYGGSADTKSDENVTDADFEEVK